MSRTGQRNTAAELRLRAELHRRGLRYRVDLAPVKGLRRRADVVFTKRRVAVFVDGCFWHGCPVHATWPKHNAEWWREKIETNRGRDRDTDRRLRELGWTVLRVWEHEDPAEAADRVEQALSGTSSRSLTHEPLDDAETESTIRCSRSPTCD